MNPKETTMHELLFVCNHANLSRKSANLASSTMCQCQHLVFDGVSNKNRTAMVMAWEIKRKKKKGIDEGK